MNLSSPVSARACGLPWSLPHLQSLWPGEVCGTRCSISPAHQGLTSPLPRPRLWGWLQGLAESQTVKTEVPPIPIWEARCPHTSAFFVPVGSAGAHSPSREPLPDKARGQALVPCGAGVMCLACQYLLPPYVLYSGPTGLPLLPTILSRPSPDPARRTVGPSMHRGLPCVSPPLCLPVRLWPSMLRNQRQTLKGGWGRRG